MIKNYLKIAWRNIIINKGYSAINIGGLAVGMTVAMLIGLWIYSELTYNKSFEHYDRIAQVWQHQSYNGITGSQVACPAVMAEAIRNDFDSDFTYVLQSSWNFDHALQYGDKTFFKSGSYFEPEVIEMLSLNMLQGTNEALQEMHSIIISKSVAETFFGTEDPMGKILKMDNEVDLKVTGVYEDLPESSTFYHHTFFLPWQLYLSLNPWIQEMNNPWGSNFTQTFAMIAPNTNFSTINSKINDVKLKRVSEGEKKYNPQVFLHPMSKWHLYSNFENGIQKGGRIDNVWLFGIIGVFVLLLACINFMNLSTARSEKRAKEVGIRKAIGSKREQLIFQFFSESILICLLAFALSIALILLIIPFFNQIAESKIVLFWKEPLFWMIGLGFSFLTGIISGLYPALYLSSFNPVKVLKGTFNVGRFAATPRKILVIFQFSISIILIIGTIVVYQQIQYAQNRPIGYSKDGLVTITTYPETYEHFDAIRNTLKNNGAIVEMTQSTSPTTDNYNTNGGFDWKGKDPDLAVDFPNNAVTHDYGATVGWKVKEGRDFSREFGTDSLAFILNESAVKFIGLKDPVGKELKWNDKSYHIIGVVEDMLIQSPYKPVRPSLFHLARDQENVYILKLNPKESANASLAKIKDVFLTYSPAIPFQANFVDEDFALKFGNERRVGKLASFFTLLAIFISCLGLFGLASYVAEQRTKEIGVRKVLGASIVRLWKMLSKDFVVLVVISCVIAVPVANYLMQSWLAKFDYRTTISWWIFLTAVVGALIVTLITVSYQAIKAAKANPVKSLRTE